MRKDIYLTGLTAALCVLFGLWAYSLIKDNNANAKILKDATLQITRLMRDPSLKPDGTSLIGSRFIDFELPDLNGKLYRLEAIRASSKLIVVFSASDCELCFNERLLWSKLYEVYPRDRLAIIGICSTKEKAEIEEFVRDKEIRFPVLRDPMQTVKNGMGFRVSPLRVILDKDNLIRNIEETQTALEAQREVMNMVDTLINREADQKQYDDK